MQLELFITVYWMAVCKPLHVNQARFDLYSIILISYKQIKLSTCVIHKLKFPLYSWFCAFNSTIFYLIINQ